MYTGALLVFVLLSCACVCGGGNMCERQQLFWRLLMRGVCLCGWKVLGVCIRWRVLGR